ncbi:unnamed protein product [Penicillium salamii]|nr:unnamed protein product [Penicillium salamii]CAG8312831.1 unnamed protein product [Penicillium salamii]CAG8360865.1 unnamed protein product [Penicillium salamii]
MRSTRLSIECLRLMRPKRPSNFWRAGLTLERWSFRSINRLHLQPYILIPWLVSDLNSFICSPPVNVALAAQANEKQPCTIVYLYHVAIEFSFRLEMLLYIKIFRVPPCS